MITDIQKRTQNMLANRKEEVPKYTTHVEPKRLVPEDGDTSSQDNNFVVPPPPPPDNRKEEPPKTSEPATPPARPSGAAEVLNKYTGIIQLGVLAVGIAGTIGAYLWSRN